MTDADKAQNYEFDASISAEEREFYLKAYPTPDNVRDRRTHCTTCKMHLGTAPGNVENIKMHPILRVTHCPKCQDFYNCGEFSKGEDGSELYCRWCGQGGEVYCCSNCPFVFCKSCITKNLSRGVVADIEQNENWRCFACAPKILWPLRAVHWALVNYIEKQKKEIEAMNLTEEEKRQEMLKDRSNCCRLAKAKCGNMSDSMDSIDSALSKRSQSSNSATKKKLLNVSPQTPAAKRQKTNNEVVCTPDLMSMLEPDCQLSVTPKPKLPVIRHGTQLKVAQVQQSYTPTPVRSLPPPPLIQLRSPSVQLRPMASNAPVIRRTVVSPRTPSPAGSHSPVYHTINGYRIDLNSAAQQGTYRLPNGKLIQVKRQSAPTGVTNQNAVPSPSNSWQQRTPMQSPVQRVQVQTQAISQQRSLASVQQQQQQKQQTPAPPLRYPSGMVGNTVISSFNQNGPQIQMVNGGVNVVNAQAAGTGQSVQIRPVMVRHTFPNNAYGVARTQFQDQIFNAMEICQHLTGKIQSLTNSNAYKTAKNYLELKELYIHMSYLLTYAIGRFKGLQDKCLGDMRQLGFGNDADSLESGQLAADKQASDNEDDEIEIVEPKTDTINLDSDEETTTSTSKQVATKNKQQQLQKMNIPAKITPVQSAAPNVPSLVPIESNENTSNDDEMSDFMSAAHTLLASMLEVDIIEGDTEINADGKHSVKKQPRKKTTNKPNPTLLKQKRLLEREKMEELKRNDAKLKMKCVINVTKVDTEYPNFKVKLEEFEKRRKEWREEQAKKAKIAQEEKVNKEALEAVAADNKEQLVDEKITDAAKIEVESNMASENEKETETEKMDCSQTAEKIKENEGLTEKLTESTMLLSDDPKENNEKVEGVASVKEAVENKTIETKNSTEIEEMETEKRENSVEVEKADKENNCESVEKESNAEESDNKIEPAGKATKKNEASEEGKEEESNDKKKMAAEIEEMETEEQEKSVQVEKPDNENNGESVEKEPNAEESDNKSEPAGKATKINEASEEGEEESTNGNKMAAEIEEMETEEQENSVEVEQADNENNRESVETESNAEESDNKGEPCKVTEINEASEEGKEDDENKITTEAFEHESQETNNFGSENEVDSARQNENEIEEKSLEDVVTETVSETAEQNLEDINSTESSSDYMLIDKAENVKEDDGQIHGTTIAQVEESNGNIVTSIDEQAFEPNNDDDESILEEIKKVLEANTENVNETTSEPLQLQLETNEMSAAGMLSPSSSSHILKGENATVVCLDTIITDNATTTTETSIFTENCEKMDIDPTTLDLPITKSNELQLDAATATSQTDDVEMATTTIEKDIASNNETIA